MLRSSGVNCAGCGGNGGQDVGAMAAGAVVLGASVRGMYVRADGIHGVAVRISGDWGRVSGVYICWEVHSGLGVVGRYGLGALAGWPSIHVVQLWQKLEQSSSSHSIPQVWPSHPSVMTADEVWRSLGLI